MIAPIFNNNNNFDIIQYVPEEVATEIFSYLDPMELGRCCAVSTYWNRVASDERLWKNLFPELNVSQNKREYICLHAVKSKEELIERIKDFMQRVNLDRIGEFRCLFPFNPNYSARVVLGYGKIHPAADPDVEELCIYVKKSLQTDAEETPSSLYLFCYDPPAIKIQNALFRIEFGRERSIKKEITFQHAAQEADENMEAYDEINRVMENRIGELKEVARRQRELYLCCAAVILTVLTLMTRSLLS